MSRSEVLQYRVSPTELQILRDAATKAHMSVAEFARWAVMTYAAGVMTEDEDAMRELVNTTSQAILARSKVVFPPMPSIPGVEWDVSST